MALKFKTIKKSANFKLACQEGFSVYQSSFLLKFIQIPESSSPTIGFIVSKKVGNAVKRNKIKRRLRMVINEIFNEFIVSGLYVFIAKSNLRVIKYQDLKEGLLRSLEIVKSYEKNNKYL